MGQEGLCVVRGKAMEVVDGRVLQQAAAAAAQVVVDLGTGDGRWAYRAARAHPTWLCVALDANAVGMRKAARRAGRKPARGGAPNAWFVRAAVEALPAALDGLADEVHVHLPWGSLLRAVAAAEPDGLRPIVRLCRPGAAICVRVNTAVLEDLTLRARLSLPGAGKHSLEARLAVGYAAAGIRVVVRQAEQDLATTWARRLGVGRPLRVLAIDGIVHGARGNGFPHGGVKMVHMPPVRGGR